RPFRRRHQPRYGSGRRSPAAGRAHLRGDRRAAHAVVGRGHSPGRCRTMSVTVNRALGVIEFCATAPRTLTEITEYLGVHKSTALRLMQTLEEGGFARMTGGRYTIGFRMIALASAALEAIDLRTVARPHLVRLSERYGHTIHLAQYVQSDIIYVDKIEGLGAVRMQSQVGNSVVLHTAAVAKAVLAYLEEPELRPLLKRVTYEKFTANTITTPAAFTRELAEIRARGWSEDDAEFEDFINCIGAPIFGFGDRVVGGISLTTLRAMVPMEQLREFVPALRECAQAISQANGATGAAP